MSTRVGHQRTFMRHQFEAQEPGIPRKYLERIAEDFPPTDVEVAFLKRLRNLLTHNQLPRSLINMSGDPPNFKIAIVMPTEPLLSWEWDNRTTAEWIKDHTDGL